MSPLVSLLLPTRGRPVLATRFLKSVADTTSHPDKVEIIIYVDDDDAESHDIDYPGLKIKRIIGSRKTMGEYNSECFEASKGDIIVLVNDDMIIKTQGWDERLRELDNSIKDKVYLAYGNDLFKKGNLCTFPILSRKTCEILQKPYHPAYRGAFIDYHLMDIFKRLEHAGYSRIFYLKDVVFEHLHYRTGKAEFDETYKARGRFDDDMLFIGLADVRKASLPLLLAEIEGKKDGGGEVLPDFIEQDPPTNIFKAALTFSDIFLGDKSLPFKWRFFMWWWFLARYIAHKLD